MMSAVITTILESHASRRGSRRLRGAYAAAVITSQKRSAPEIVAFIIGGFRARATRHMPRFICCHYVVYHYWRYAYAYAEY